MSRVVQSLLKDNSLQKELRDERKLKRRFMVLSNQIRESISRTKNISQVRRNIFELEQTKSYIQEVLLEFEKTKSSEEAAARLIQAFYRKRLINQSIKETVLPDIKTKVNSKLSNTLKSLKFMKLNVGDKLLHSTVHIQRAYRRHLFYKKILRIQNTSKLYKRYLRNKPKETIKLMLRVQFCKIMVAKAEKEKEIIHKLQAIKERLAIITIKNVWKSLKLTPQHMLKRLKFWKSKMLKRREIKNRNSLNRPCFKFKQGQFLKNLTMNEEALSSIFNKSKFKQMENKALKKRVKKSKVAYNIRSPKTNSRITPVSISYSFIND